MKHLSARLQRITTPVVALPPHLAEQTIATVVVVAWYHPRVLMLMHLGPMMRTKMKEEKRIGNEERFEQTRFRRVLWLCFLFRRFLFGGRASVSKTRRLERRNRRGRELYARSQESAGGQSVCQSE
jgi:hypothetical protein